MNVTPRKLLGYSWAALGCGLLPVFYLALQEPPGRMWRYPDGTSVEVRGITYGTDSSFEDGPIWKRFLARLPSLNPGPPVVVGTYPVSARSIGSTSSVIFVRGVRPLPSTTRTPQLVLWTRNHGEGLSVGVEPGPPVLIDEHGCRLPSMASDPAAQQAYQQNEWGDIPIVLSTFPRRSASFNYAPVDTEGNLLPVSFPVPNPAPRSYPQWQPGSLPLTTHSGSVAFTLKRLALHREPHDATDYARAFFTYEEQGRPTENWRPASITVSDATGNRITNEQVETGPWTFYSLCRKEHAWKLDVLFHRAAPERAPAELTWTLRDVVVPPRKILKRVRRSFAFHGVKLWARAISGGGATHDPDNGSIGDKDSSPTLEVNTATKRKDLQLTLVQVRDQRGRELLHRKDGTRRWRDGIPCADTGPIIPGHDTFSYELQLPKDARRLSFSFVVSQGQRTTFLVPPP